MTTLLERKKQAERGGDPEGRKEKKPLLPFLKRKEKKEKPEENPYLKGKRKKKAPKPPKPKRKIVNINDDNSIRPKKNTAKTVLRSVAWIMLCWVFVRGVTDILKPDPLVEFQRRTQDFMREQADSRNRELELYAFAQNFAREYLSYESGGMEDYSARIRRYMPGGQAVLGTRSLKTTAQAVYVEAWKLEEYAPDQYDVYVMAVVEYPAADSVKAGNEVTMRTDTENTYLKVPVRALSGGLYVVEDVPMFVAEARTGSWKGLAFTGKEAEKETAGQISTVLKNFFKALYEENQTRIAYYLAEGTEQDKFRGLDGRFTFGELSGMTAWQDPQDSSRYLVIVELSVLDRNSQPVLQRFNLLVRQEGERFYILDMDTRTTDIKYDFQTQ